MTRWLLICVLILLLIAAWVAVSRRSANALVVYCAHDLVFAEEILREFEEQTGTKVVIVGDTEATKSLGLVQRLIREKDHPQCDVFWNNQVLGTIQLAEEGVLEAYRGSGYERIPEAFKDPLGLWCGFAGRLRVWIVNTDRLSASENEVADRLASEDLSRMAIALPIYGTTLSHFSLLWHRKGSEELQSWYASLSERGCQIVQGNATVKNLVAEGVCDLGWTDTDDFFVALDAGFPVAMLPIRVAEKTICIPNSVALIKGTKRRREAESLIDFLLSKQTELKLAASDSRQIPLGAVNAGELPTEVQPLATWATESHDVTHLSGARRDTLDWLLREFAP